MSDELAPSEVARRLGTSTRTVQRWIERGLLPARRVGGRLRVANDAFGAFEQGLGARGHGARGHGARGPRAQALAPPRQIQTLFIANRGEIAGRITRTADRLGIRAIVPATDGPDAVDLLDGAAVVSAARDEGADALHPGFGFLAESAEFAQQVLDAGIRWVGPPPDAIRAMGDKAAARRLAASLGVSVLPGYDDADQSDGALGAAAERIGYPVLVKPSAGGGGKGMRVVREASLLDDALASARREARAAFGDDRLILERFVEGGRHIEIQVLFDATGNGVHLGERDCSLQRRHQKVLEETPSPAVTPALRARLGDAALTLASAVGYVNAGTCEFLVDDRGEPAFLEMNTRLQVEHPVTELVTGRDLVADQLRIAAGEPLGFEQVDVDAVGHAIEVRLYAEDAEDGFLPATGRIEALRWPSGEGVRVDAGVAVGDVVGSRFDPMLAKIVAYGATRHEALDRLTGALDRTVVLGIVTNLRFLRWLVRQEVVRDGEARTNTLDRIWPPEDWAARAVVPSAAWATAAARLARDDDPWSGGWRLNSVPRVRIESDGVVRSVPIDRSVPQLSAATVVVDGVVHVDLVGRSIAFRLAPAPDVERAARAATATHAGGSVDVVAPMPGSVLAVHVVTGGTVAAGDPVVTIEAMKMEHLVVAAADGRIADITVVAADQVTRGQRLATIEPST